MNHSMQQKNTKLKTFILYTVLFTMVMIIVSLPFFEGHKHFIWKKDGLYQTYTIMVYISEYYKGIFGHLLHGQFTWKMFDFNIGMGNDVFTTLNYYGFLGDPLLLFSTFFNKTNMYICYDMLFVLRLFLAGLFFILYCKKMEKGNIQAVLGALIYAFCGYAIAAGERHPYFLNAMIYLPLLFIGVETILKKKKSYLFTIMILISFVSNFYFFYMLTIIVFIYALIRFIDVYRREWLHHIFSILFRGIIQYALGVALASIALFPIVDAYKNNSRGTVAAFTASWHYERKYYVRLIYAFFNPPHDLDSAFVFLSYASIAFFVIMAFVFYKKIYKKHISLFVTFLFASAMLLIPVAGYMMNAMSYVTNRWIFGYSFLIAFIVVCTIDEVLKLSFKQFIPMIVIAVLVCVGYMIYEPVKELFPWQSLCIMVGTLVVLCILTQVSNRWLKYALIFATVVISMGYNGFYKNSDSGYNYSDEFRSTEDIVSKIDHASESHINTTEDKSFYRIGSIGDNAENQALILQYNGTASYYSLVGGKMFEYLKELEIPSIQNPDRWYGFDERTIPDALASVKYYAFEKDSREEATRPFGYKKTDEIIDNDTGKTYNIYENQYALPIGYTYDATISRDYYDSLSALDKQEALMQAAVTDLSVNNNVDDKLQFSDTSLDYQVIEDEGITWDQENHMLHVDSPDSKLKIEFEAIPNCETYVRFHNLNIDPNTEGHFAGKLESNNVRSAMYFTASDYRWALDREDYMIHLGHENDGKTVLELTFERPGDIELDDIAIHSVPMDSYVAQVTKLGTEAMTDVKVIDNKVTGKIKVSQDKILCFSMMNVNGWTLKVDGVTTPLSEVNTMYMGTKITKGAHTIELSYQTPGLKLGATISAITCILILLGFIIERSYKKKRNTQEIHNKKG